MLIKHRLIILLGFVICLQNQIYSQCPVFTNSDLSSPDCTNGSTPCDVCVGDMFTLSAGGTDLPDGGCVDWYYSTSPVFDPYLGQGTYMGCGAITTTGGGVPCDECPLIEALYADACGNEVDNEYFIISSGSGFNLNDLSVSYPNFDVGGNAGIPPCGWQTPTVTISGCANVIYAGPGTDIPAGVPVAVFISSAANYVYDFSAVCGSGPIYVVQSSCYRSTPAFRNYCMGGCGTRTLSISLACGCSDDLTYEPGQLTGAGDGDYILANQTYGNDGCVAPPVALPPPPPNSSTVDPFDFTATADLCNGGPYYVQGIINPDPQNSGCARIYTNSFSFNVQCPSAQISGDNDICEGESTTLTASGGNTYQWSTGQYTQSIIVAPGASQTYSVTVSIGNCEDYADIVVDVTPAAVPNLSTDQICETETAYDLNFLEDPAYPNGSWSGPGVAGDFFDATGLAGPVSLTFTPTAPCVATTSTTVFVDQLVIPVLEVGLTCETGGNFDLTTLEDPAYPVGTWTGPGVNGTTFDPSGFAGDIPVTFISSDYCVDESTTFITVLSEEEPNLGTADICKNGGLYNLTQLVDPNFPDGFWTGPGVSGDFFDPSGQNGFVTLVFTPSASCTRPASTDILIINGGTPILQKDTICQNSGLYDLGQLQDPAFANGSWLGPGVMNDTLNPAALTGVVTLTFQPGEACTDTVITEVLIIPSEYPDLKRDSLCQDAGILDLQTLEDTAFSPGVWSGPGVSNNNFNPDGLNGPVQLTYTPAGLCDLSAQTTVHVFTPLQVVVDTIICNMTNDSFQVVISINGGIPGTWLVHGDSGTLNGRQFASVPIASNASYNFTISEASPCDAVAINGSFNCGCATNAGTMQIPNAVPLLFCESDTARVIHNRNHNLENDDTLRFILHTNAGVTPGDILAINDSVPCFFYNPDTMALDSTYYISAIAGNNDNSGFIDLMDTCLSVARGVPVRWIKIPEARFMRDTSICAGEGVDVRLNFSGLPDFIYQVSINGDTLPPDTTNLHEKIFTHSGDSSTIFEIISFENEVCSGIVTEPSVRVEVQPALTLALIDTTFFANGTFTAEFRADGGDSSYQFTGVPGTSSGRIFIANPVPCGDTIALCVSSGACDTVCFRGTFDCEILCVTDAGQMGTDTLHLCPGGTALAMHDNAILDSDDTIQFVLHTASGPGLGNQLQTNSLPAFGFIPGMQFETVYYISAVAGNNDGFGNVDLTDSCLSVSAGTPVVWHESPTALIRAPAAVCRGDSVEVQFLLTGQAPYVLSYTVNGATQSPVSGSADTMTVRLTANTDLQIQLDTLADRYCGTQSANAIAVGVIPDLSATIDGIICDSMVLAYRLVIDINGGDSTSYSVSGNYGGDIANRIFTSELIPGDSSYQFIITDGNGCDSVLLSGSYDCNCITFAGAIEAPTGGSVLVCSNDSVVISASGDARLDQDDIFEYILTDSPGPGVGNIISRNTDGIFRLEAGLNFGATYYIVGIAGTGDGSGRVDFADDCLSLTNRIPVVFWAYPGVSINYDSIICSGNCADIEFTFSGLPDFTVNYTAIVDGIPDPVSITTSDNYSQDRICPSGDASSVRIFIDKVSSNGCVTEVMQDFPIQINQPGINDIQRQLCEGQSITVNNVVYDIDNPVDTIVLSAAAANNCDSIIYINLTFTPQKVTDIDTTLCASDFIIVNGNRYDQTMPVGREIITVNACDSIINIDLDFYNIPPTDVRDTLCAGDSLFINGNWYSESRPSGTEILTTSEGCDSLLQINLFFNSGNQVILTDTLCSGDSIQVGPDVFHVNNPRGVVAMTNENGCDSIVQVDLSFRPVPLAVLSGPGGVCAGDSARIILYLEGANGADVIISNDQGTDYTFASVQDSVAFFVAPSVPTIYEITAVDIGGNRCPVQIGAPIKITVSQISLSAEVTDFNGFEISCHGAADGTITVIAQNGMPPYTVEWSDNKLGFVRNNLGPGGYEYTVTDFIGCMVRDSVVLSAPEQVIAEILTQNPDCRNTNPGSIKLDRISGGTGIYNVAIDTGAFLNIGAVPFIIHDVPPGNYTVIIQDENNCRYQQFVHIAEPQLPQVTLPADTLIALGDSIYLAGVTNITPASVQWEPGLYLHCDTCLQTTAGPVSDITYTITVFDQGGCAGTDEISIRVFSRQRVYIPTGFSPNGDGINDVFRVYAAGEAVNIRQFMIFDRWGNAVYQAENLPPSQPDAGWNGQYKGQPMDPGVYVFFAEVEFLDGTAEIYKGEVTLLR